MESEYIKSLMLEDGFAQFKSVKELDTAINDLLSQNYFSVIGNKGKAYSGPYELRLGIADNRMILKIKTGRKLTSRRKEIKITVPLTSFRSIIKDYFIVCESYQEMLKTGIIEKVEAVDMGRRSMHNEGAEILLKLLERKINIDFETARRLFTIITVLHVI